MRFRTNLATRVYIDAKRLTLCITAVLLLLLLLLVLNVRNIAAKAEETRRLTNDIEVLKDKSKVASKGVTEKEYKELLARIGFANSMIEKKTYNWLELLDKLETVVPDGVAISSIEPEPKSQGLKLAGVARSFNNLRIFMERMEDSSFFTDVYLLGQSEVRDTKEIAFQLTCGVAVQ